MTERVERWSRGVAALALLAGLVVGVPAALLVLAGDPVPRRVDLASLWQTLLRPDDGTVLARLLALVGWVAWAVFVLTLVVELVNLVRRRRRGLVLPGLGGVQQWAAGLMLAVVAIGAATQVVSGAAGSTPVVARAVPEVERPPARPETPNAPGDASGRPRSEHARPATTDVAPSPSGSGGTPVDAVPEDLPPGPHLDAPTGRRERVHVVRTGDDLWSLAERYYGRGQDWRRIAAANPDLLTGGPDRLRVGWRLVVPGEAERPEGDAGDRGRRVRVRSGDTLSAIADRELGDAARWRDVYRANRDQLGDPDELPAGLLLRLPGSSSEADDRDDRDTEGASQSDAPVPRRERAERPPTSADPVPAPSSTPPPAPVPGPTSEAASRPAGTPATAADGRGPADDARSTNADDGPAVLVPGLATVGGLLAAALLGGLAARRRWQLRNRPLGRRIAHPAPAARPAEVALARQARPIGLRTLDRASRAVAAAAAEAGVAVPPLRSASVSDDWLVLELAGPTPPAPHCFVDTGGSWCLAADAVDGLRDVPGFGEASRPWPLLVTLGLDDEGSERVVDLESWGLLALEGAAGPTTAVMAAMALELACSPWTDELRLTLVGDDRLAPALAQHNVRTDHDLDAVLGRWERSARERTAHAAGRAPRDLRLDPDRAEAWTPEVVLVDADVSSAQAERLARLALSSAGLTAVVRGRLAAAPATLALGGDGRATLLPSGVRLVPQALSSEGLDHVVELVSATGREETDPAPWWSSDDPPEDPPDNVTYLGRRRRAEETDEQERRAAVEARMTGAADGTAAHPLLRLIGPVDLVGAAGTPPPRAAKQCLEYCAWLIENPGTTAQAMAAGLLVAEGTRRSNMSRLRTWLGNGVDGEPYLPDAYSGRIWLDPVVSSDWHQLQLLVGEGVDRVATSVLELGLRLVRGAPFADAAPVQWHWAEELRTDIVSCIRDIGVELTRRALADGDLDLARWSAARALVVAPADELLMTSRIRTEHQAGNAAETERLCLQLAQQARMLGADLAPATVDLVQEVMEGRLRARFA